MATEVVDRTTDMPHLERTLHEQWRQHGAEGVNAFASPPAVHLVRAERRDGAAVGDLLDHMFAVAAARLS